MLCDTDTHILIRDMTRSRYRDLVDEWLDDDENLDAWEGHMPMCDRRMCMAKWAAEAWKRCCCGKYDKMLTRLFERTGCHIGLLGRHDAAGRLLDERIGKCSYPLN